MRPPLVLYDRGIWCKDGKASDLTRHTQPGGFNAQRKEERREEKVRLLTFVGKDIVLH